MTFLLQALLAILCIESVQSIQSLHLAETEQKSESVDSTQGQHENEQATLAEIRSLLDTTKADQFAEAAVNDLLKYNKLEKSDMMERFMDTVESEKPKHKKAKREKKGALDSEQSPAETLQDVVKEQVKDHRTTQKRAKERESDKGDDAALDSEEAALDSGEAAQKAASEKLRKEAQESTYRWHPWDKSKKKRSTWVEKQKAKEKETSRMETHSEEDQEKIDQEATKAARATRRAERKAEQKAKHPRR
jgi:hypothetical protein